MTGGKVVCPVCPHHCALADGETGRCRARAARNGAVVSLNYGRVASLCLDPVEKKPFARWRPGQFILSVGSFGCNLRCPFCQNDAISQAGAAFPTTAVSPSELARLAGELIPRGNVGVAFTYNEPLIGYEYVRDTARLLKAARLSAAVVTNGCIAPRLFGALLPLVDAFNIDLKGWRASFYDWVGGRFGCGEGKYPRGRGGRPCGSDDAYRAGEKRRSCRHGGGGGVAGGDFAGLTAPHQPLFSPLFDGGDSGDAGGRHSSLGRCRPPPFAVCVRGQCVRARTM
ncbi:MAG: radical SAM protein [Schwartzia sp. (in: firmicutes)]